MSRRLISTGSPFEKAAGYSRAVVDGDFCFVAGTTGYDYATMTMPADIAAQARNCFKTIRGVLEEAGFAMADIVRATYYITDAADADAMFAVCGETLGDIRPAATLLVVAVPTATVATLLAPADIRRPGTGGAIALMVLGLVRWWAVEPDGAAAVEVAGAKFAHLAGTQAGESLEPDHRCDDRW